MSAKYKKETFNCVIVFFFLGLLYSKCVESVNIDPYTGKSLPTYKSTEQQNLRAEQYPAVFDEVQHLLRTIPTTTSQAFGNNFNLISNDGDDDVIYRYQNNNNNVQYRQQQQQLPQQMPANFNNQQRLWSGQPIVVLEPQANDPNNRAQENQPELYLRQNIPMQRRISKSFEFDHEEQPHQQQPKLFQQQQPQYYLNPKLHTVLRQQQPFNDDEYTTTALPPQLQQYDQQEQQHQGQQYIATGGNSNHHSYYHPNYEQQQLQPTQIYYGNTNIVRHQAMLPQIQGAFTTARKQSQPPTPLDSTATNYLEHFKRYIEKYPERIKPMN